MLGFMPRAILFGPLLAGLVGLAAIPSSAASPGIGKIAYAVFNDGLYTVNPDGSDVARLRSGPVSDPRWSPEGSRIAFTEYTGTVGEFRLVGRASRTGSAGDAAPTTFTRSTARTSSSREPARTASLLGTSTETSSAAAPARTS